MITIKAGNYHTLTEIAASLAVHPKEIPKLKTRLSRIARRLKLGLTLSRLMVRYHDKDVEVLLKEIGNGAKG
jgi:hypothetical protein